MPDRLDPRFDLAFTLNDATVSASTTTSTTLADLLRRQRGGRGTRLSCERAVCGACTVLIDGVPRASCAVFAFEVEQHRDGRILHVHVVLARLEIGEHGLQGSGHGHHFGALIDQSLIP